MLEADDWLAYCLMSDDTPRPSPQLETRERYALTWEEAFEVREGRFWTHDGRKATAHPAFPAGEILRAVAAARRR